MLIKICSKSWTFLSFYVEIAAACLWCRVSKFEWKCKHTKNCRGTSSQKTPFNKYFIPVWLTRSFSNKDPTLELWYAHSHLDNIHLHNSTVFCTDFEKRVTNRQFYENNVSNALRRTPKCLSNKGSFGLRDRLVVQLCFINTAVIGQVGFAAIQCCESKAD